MGVIANHLCHVLWIRSKSLVPPIGGEGITHRCDHQEAAVTETPLSVCPPQVMQSQPRFHVNFKDNDISGNKKCFQIKVKIIFLVYS